MFSQGTLTSLGDVQLWLGLKNSDDVGTNFDVRAEVYADDAMIASGESHCISGITRNPALAKAVGVAFDPFSPFAFAGSTQVLSLRLLARIGTNASGGPCGGHVSAAGLRAYFDATSRPAAFDAAFTRGAHVIVSVIDNDTELPVAGATVALYYRSSVPEPPPPSKATADPDPTVVTGVTDENGVVEFADQRIGVPLAIIATDELGRMGAIKSTTFVAGDNSCVVRMTPP